MRITRIRKICGVLLFLIAVPSGIATAQNYIFRHLNTRSGVAGGFIYDIQQDERGFIWIATETGLSKYDGNTFTNYRNNSDFSNSLSDNIVTRLVVLPGNRFLIGHDSGIDLLTAETEAFRSLRFPASMPDMGRVLGLKMDEQGDLWIASDQQLYHFPEPDFDADTLQGTAYHHQMDDNGEFRALNFYRGEIWLGSLNGVYVFNPVSQVFRKITSSDEAVSRILQTTTWDFTTGPDGNLYISFLGGLLRFNRDGNRLENLTEKFIPDSQTNFGGFQDLFVDSENNLWVGTGLQGAYRWNMFTDELTRFNASDSNVNTVNSSDIHFIYEDEQQNIWFGYHEMGVSLMYSQSWNYTFALPFPELPRDDPKNTLTMVKMDDRSVIWGLTENGLIRELGNDNAEYVEIDREALGINENGILVNIVHFTDSEIFLAVTGHPDLVIFDTESKTYRNMELELPGEPIPLEPVLSNNHIYIGMFTSTQLLKLNPNTYDYQLLDLPVTEGNAVQFITNPETVIGSTLYLKFYNIVPPQINFESFTLDVEADSMVFEPHEVRVNVSLGGFGPPLNSTYEPGISYWNVAAGLLRVNNLNGESDVLFLNQVPLIREGTNLMVEDNQGYIWMNNQTGLMRLDPLTESISYFEVPDEKKPTNLGMQTMLLNGEMFFPGEGGYIRFDPSQLEAEQPIGETIITSLQSVNQTYHTIYSSDDITLPSSENNLTFTFIGMNFRDPGSTHYRYRILGSDDEKWNLVESQRSVFIPNLSSGTYTFEVQSGSQFGSFNEESATLSFTILPPWWNTIPAYILYFCMLGGLIFSVDRIQRRRLLYKEKERNREKELKQAREIETAYHDLEQAHEQLKSAQVQLVQQEKLASLGQLTAGIAHEIKNPLNFVNNFSDLSMEMIQEAKENLKTLKGKLKKEDQQLIHDTLEALENVEHNLKKIHKHGSRADRIVKSMLQHSRGGNGDKSPTDLNDLLREYVNLAFHGMRAGKKPINVDIKLQLEDNLPELPIISEDFSRVIVNLCNNAFDAMRVKLEKDDTDEYNPVLTVRSHSMNDQVILEFEDNGPGISEEHKDKVLQPFFTTKKGTEGTGLGLSITHDIIKAHGGTMDIETKEDNFTRFKVYLNK